MNYKLIKKSDTIQFSKNGVDFIGYGNINEDMAIVVETVEKGHFEEFVHTKSTFTYLFLEGNGIFVLDDKQIQVQAGDVLSIKPGTRIYYFGNLKQVLITTPAYEEKYEKHIRNIPISESPFYSNENNEI